MTKFQTAILITSFLLGTTALRGQDHSEIIRGTINVVLANSQGMVVETDSAQTITDANGQRLAPKQAEKLVQLDDHSICAIAGFGGATVPTATQFNIDVIGIINDVREKIAGRPPLSFDSKLKMLSSLVQFHLSAVANLNEVAQASPFPSHAYTFSLFLVGYDVDGAPKIGTLELFASVDGKRHWSFSDKRDVSIVGQNLTCKLAGMWDAAQQVMLQPDNYSDAIVRKYGQSMRIDGGASLTLADLKALADFLSDESSRRHPLEIGGARQIGVLQSGKIEQIEKPSFPEAPKPLVFTMMNSVQFSGHGVSAPPGSHVHFLWINCKLARDPMLRLDDNFFLGTEIHDSVVWYDGGVTLFDKTNIVENSMLVLGPNVDMKSSTVRDLVRGFRWSNQAGLSK